MTVYRLIGPHVVVRGSIDEILATVSAEIDPHQFYWFDDREDITGEQLMVKLIAIKEQAEPSHSYVKSVVFGRSVGGNPGDYRITRIVEPADAEPVTPGLS